MTSKDAFTEDAWIRLRRAPMVAGMAISIADPGGPIELTKETMASHEGSVVAALERGAAHRRLAGHHVP